MSLMYNVNMRPKSISSQITHNPWFMLAIMQLAVIYDFYTNTDIIIHDEAYENQY